MKRLKRTVLFFIILGILICVCSYWIGNMAARFPRHVSEQNRAFTEIGKEKKDSVDLLVLGDSESYTSVSPMQMWEEKGITAYVCGQPGQKIQSTYYMLKTALQVQSPKVVILETNLMFRDPGPVETIHASVTEPLGYYFPIFRYHNLWKAIFNGKKPGEVSYKGFILRGGVSPFDSGDYMKQTGEIQNIPKAVEIYMEEIRKMCNKNGAFLVLMSAPSPRNYNYKKHNAIAAYAQENGLPYLDLNLHAKELGMDWNTDSYDKGDHLNLNGARKVTTWVGEYLKENYALPDHRGEDGYRSWDEETKKYKESVKKLAL